MTQFATIQATAEGTSILTRTSPRTRTENTRALPVCPDKLASYYRGEIGGLIQDIFPELDADDREFVKTGFTPEDWAIMFPPEDDEEDEA